MPPELVSLAEQVAYLGLLSPSQQQQAQLQILINAATDLFQADCCRSAAPFSPAQEGRIEVHPANGGAALWLDYPPKQITAVKLGFNFTTPDETLDPADPEVVVWAEGDRCLQRVDGGVWSAGSGVTVLSWARGGSLVPEAWEGPRGRVQITYDTLADQPASAKAAVMRAVAALLSQKGSEGLRAETRGARSFQFMTEKDPEWQGAVVANYRTVTS